MPIFIKVSYPEVQGRVSEAHIQTLKKFEPIIKERIVRVTCSTSNYTWRLDESVKTTECFELVKRFDKSVLEKFDVRNLQRWTPQEFISELKHRLVFSRPAASLH